MGANKCERVQGDTRHQGRKERRTAGGEENKEEVHSGSFLAAKGHPLLGLKAELSMACATGVMVNIMGCAGLQEGSCTA